MEKISFHNPSIIISEWLPMGRTNMLTLNRHLGSHKNYKSGTEFGMKGSVKELDRGVFKMEGRGIFLEPDNFTFSGSMKARIRNSLFDENNKGVELDKDGSSLIGLSFDKDIGIEKTKELIGKEETEFSKQFVPLLAENQINLLKSAYGVQGFDEKTQAMSSYALVISDTLGIEIRSTKEFQDNEKTKHALMPLTDWVTEHFTIDGNHFFIGMKAMVFIGKYSNDYAEFIKGILFQKTMVNVSTRMFSTLWVTRKKLEKIRSEISSASYKKLKGYNIELSEINTDFSRQNILSDIISNSVKNKQIEWDKILVENKQYSSIYTGEGFVEELEKAEERNLLIKQMNVEIEGLRFLLDQRMNMIMNKNAQKLNLILLILTVISIHEIAGVFGYHLRESILVLFIVVPFAIYAIGSFIQYHKDFD